MSELIKADNEYKEWIAGISTDFRAIISSGIWRE